MRRLYSRAWICRNSWSVGWNLGAVDGRTPLAGQLDVDQSCHSLYAAVMLGVVEEVSLTALVRRMPIEDVKLRIARH